MNRSNLKSSARIFRAIAICILVWEVRESGAQDLTFEKIADETLDACAALAKHKQESEESAFDFRAITTYGKLADAFLIKKQFANAKKVLMHSLPAKDVDRLVATTSVKFGVPIPQIPDTITPQDAHIWRLEIFISLVHGNRLDEANNFLDGFEQKYQNPLFRLRYLKLIAKQCQKSNDQSRGRQTASLMWEQTKSLKPPEVDVKIDYLLYLAEFAQAMGFDQSAEKLIAVVKPLIDGDDANPNQDDRKYRLMKRLGLLDARSGKFADSIRSFAKAAFEIEQVKDKYFERELAHAELKLALAEAYRLQKLNPQAVKYTKEALNWVQKAADKASDRSSIAASLDGGSGFFSTVLGMGQHTETKEIVLEQIKLGENELATQTWKSMPVSLQKLVCQIDAARYYHQAGKLEEVNQCARRCLELENEMTLPLDRVAFRAAALTIYDLSGQRQKRDELITQLLAMSKKLDDDSVRQNLAEELIAIGQQSTAYEIVQSIESPKDRASPLASLAKSLALKPLTKLP